MENSIKNVVFVETVVKRTDLPPISRKLQLISKNGQIFNLRTFKTIADGNCLIHSFLGAFSQVYRSERLPEKQGGRQKYQQHSPGSSHI